MEAYLDFPPVTSKAEFYPRFLAGEFGNRGPMWNSKSEFIRESQESCLYHLRNKVVGGSTFYNLPPAELLKLWTKGGNWVAAEMAPHKFGKIQGEVQQGVKGLELFYAPALVPMREALAKEGKQVRGLLAVSLLKENLCPNSWEWLNILLDRYPEHVIEFSSFSVNWGTLPNFNTVVWECRLY